MSDPINPSLAMSVDLKKYRIRIHKATLHLLGDPRYIQLLINPRSMNVAVRAVEKRRSGDQTHLVNQRLMNSDNSIELYSRSLVEKIREVVPDLDDGFSYRISGDIIPAQKMAVFALNTLCPIKMPRGVLHG